MASWKRVCVCACTCQNWDTAGKKKNAGSATMRGRCRGGSSIWQCRAVQVLPVTSVGSRVQSVWKQLLSYPWHTHTCVHTHHYSVAVNQADFAGDPQQRGKQADGESLVSLSQKEKLDTKLPISSNILLSTHLDTRSLTCANVSSASPLAPE